MGSTNTGVEIWPGRMRSSEMEEILLPILLAQLRPVAVRGGKFHAIPRKGFELPLDLDFHVWQPWRGVTPGAETSRVRTFHKAGHLGHYSPKEEDILLAVLSVMSRTPKKRTLLSMSRFYSSRLLDWRDPRSYRSVTYQTIETILYAPKGMDGADVVAGVIDCFQDQIDEFGPSAGIN
jgi:hypothetical protein